MTGNKENEPLENDFKVEYIKKHHIYPDKSTYVLVKWEGYEDPNEDTWEPIEGMFNCKNVLERYIKENNQENEINIKEIKWSNPEKEKKEAEAKKNFTSLNQVLDIVDTYKKLQTYNKSPIDNIEILNNRNEKEDWKENTIYLLSYQEHLSILLKK